ncbi:MAG: hypothetical protein WDN26_17375 [Chitinophagaceae bacterium]
MSSYLKTKSIKEKLKQPSLQWKSCFYTFVALEQKLKKMIVLTIAQLYYQ